MRPVTGYPFSTGLVTLEQAYTHYRVVGHTEVKALGLLKTVFLALLGDRYVLCTGVIMLIMLMQCEENLQPSVNVV